MPSRVLAPAAHARRDEPRVHRSRDRDRAGGGSARRRSRSRPRRTTCTSRSRSRHDAASSDAPYAAPHRPRRRFAPASCGRRGRRRALRGRRAPAATASRRRGPPERAARSPCARRSPRARRAATAAGGRAQPVDGSEVLHVHGIPTVPSSSAARMSPSGTGASSSRPRRKSTAARCGSTCAEDDAQRPAADDDLAAPRAHDVERSHRVRELSLVARHAAASAAATARRRARRRSVCGGPATGKRGADSV